MYELLESCVKVQCFFFILKHQHISFFIKSQPLTIALNYLAVSVLISITWAVLIYSVCTKIDLLFLSETTQMFLSRFPSSKPSHSDDLFMAGLNHPWYVIPLKVYSQISWPQAQFKLQMSHWLGWWSACHICCFPPSSHGVSHKWSKITDLMNWKEVL